MDEYGLISCMMSTIETSTAANIVGVMIASRENCSSVANYVERILRLKKRDLDILRLRNM